MRVSRRAAGSVLAAAAMRQARSFRTKGLIVATATRNPEISAEAKSWRVRNEQGETFGPVDFETLKAWACDGRLAPTNEVSDNGSDWKPATSQSGLDMDWVAEVTPGTFYGPIHKAAMKDLVKEGSIAALSPFFMRQTLAADPAGQRSVDPQIEQLRQQLAEQIELCKRQADADAAQLELARRQAAAEIESSLQQAAVLVSELEQARRQAAEADVQVSMTRQQIAAQTEQIRQQAALAASELEKTRQQAADAETRATAVRQQLALQAEQAARDASVAASELEKTRRQAADAEAQAKAARQQVAAHAEQIEQAKQVASVAAAEFETMRRQMSAQAEQARAIQQQSSEKTGELDRQLAQARQEEAATAVQLKEVLAEIEARGVAWAAKEQAFDAERHSLQSAVVRAQAEASARLERATHLERALAEAGRAVQEGRAVETQVQVLRAELESLRSALAEERTRGQETRTQCADLSAALNEEEQGRSSETQQVAALRGELAQARRQAEGLRTLFRQAEAIVGAQPASTVVVESLEAEPMEPRTRQPVCPKPADKPFVDAELLPPERERPKPAEKPPVASRHPAGHAKPGISMADLEQQARRELERLGAQGSLFFKKKK